MENIAEFLSDKSTSVLVENIRNIFFILASIAGVWLLHMRSRALKKQAEISEKGHNLESFNVSINILESDNYNIRIASIHSLRLLMAKDHTYYWPIVKVFTSYANHYLSTIPEADEKNKSINRSIVQEMIKALGDEEIHWLPHLGSSNVKSINFIGNVTRAFVAWLQGYGTFKCYFNILTQAQKNKHTMVFRNTDLTKINFAGLFVSVAEFHKCTLDKTYFSHSDAHYTRFKNCSFENSKLINSNFYEATFDSCSLKNVSFDNTDLGKAKFIKCNLEKVDFSKAHNFNEMNVIE